MLQQFVAVIRGGPSSEYSVSMNTGMAVLDSLRSQVYRVVDIVISRDGDWLREGKTVTPEIALEGIDTVFIALHGTYAEDGEVQRILRRLRIPYNGSGPLASAIAFNKLLTKETLMRYGVLMPKHVNLKRTDIQNIDDIISSVEVEFGPEYIIKPLSNGSSIGVQLVHAGQPLKQAVLDSLSTFDSILVEELVRGKEATSAILENYRGEDIYSFPAIEIALQPDTQFFSNEAKYSKPTEVICPARFSFEERELLSEVTQLVHKTLNLRQYSRSDFIVRDGKVYFLEVNTLPGLTKSSLYPKAAEAVGMTFDQLVEHLVQTSSICE
ncbi:MAG: D-alanine--D-alanine ligase [Candidatus Nomurabacteria bacterium]|nr:MAG: D-alanine--D-alanine ligase [Candidatus Nomurabacteria bacterium]